MRTDSQMKNFVFSAYSLRTHSQNNLNFFYKRLEKLA